MKRALNFRNLMAVLVLPFILSLLTTEAWAASNLTEVQDYAASSPADNHGDVRLPDTMDAVAAQPSSGPDINIWYGDTQDFGFLGNPQTMINILGDVSDPPHVTSLTYSLNGVYQGPLSFDSDDCPRLVADGDFNIEIDTVDLVDGPNTVVITAIDAYDNQSTKEVTVNYSAGNTWPEPYSINWSEETEITDVAQIVDGRWELETGELETDSIRPIKSLNESGKLEIGYDRLVAIGDIAWDNFEVTVPIKIHSFDGSNTGGVGIIARWQGHFVYAGEQPGMGWWNIGAYGYYRNRDAGPNLVLRTGHDPSTVKPADPQVQLSLGTTYNFKLRVRTRSPGQSGFYSFRVWRAGQPEPSWWHIKSQDEPPEQLFNGSVLLVAHHTDASFGDVTIVPVVDVEVSTVGNGEVDVDPELVHSSDAYLYGDVITLTETPDPGWMFMGWSGGLSGTDNPATLTLTGDTAITATFAQIRSLTVNVVGNGIVNKDPDAPIYGEGTVVTLTAVPDPGWSFAGWSGDLWGTDNPETILIDGDKTVTATFTQDEYTLTVNYDGDGSVDKYPDKTTYHYGDVVTLTATADPNWTFTGWSGALSGPDNPETITMDGNKTVTATFTQDEYTLTVNTAGNGSVAKDPEQATYHYGDVVTLTATTDPGWTFAGWSGALSGSANPETITITGDETVSAIFTQDEYTLTGNVVGDGSVARDPDQATYHYGDVVTLTATADPNWTFTGWSGALSGSDNPETITMDGDKTVTAIFTQDEYTLTVNVVGDGTVAKDPDQAPYHYGDVVTLTATADPGWTFAGWSGALSGSDNPETITITGDATVTAIFTQDKYTLTVNVVGDGTVAKYPDQATYHYGDVVTLTATADPGWTFAGWSGALSGSDNPETITMDGNKTVSATFTQDEYTLTVNVAGDGSVAIDPLSGPYHYDDVVTLTANADDGWTFAGWSGALSGSDNPETILIDGDKTVTATFTQDEYTLTVNYDGDGSVTIDPPSGPYHYDDVVTLTATANPGWTFAGWSGALSGSDNPETITMDGDETVTATFTQDEYTLTVNVASSGSVGKYPDQTTYHYGDVVTLTATTDPNWTFTGWSGALSGSDNPETITITGTTSITATFTQDEYTLTVNYDGDGSVAIDPPSGPYHYDDVVTLTATADPGWTFAGWSGALSGSDNPETITMDSNKTITATFTQDEYTLTVNVASSGSVAKYPDQATYHYGDVVTLTANADDGWTFAGWSGALSGSDNPGTITITGDATVTATFTEMGEPEPGTYQIFLPFITQKLLPLS